MSIPASTSTDPIASVVSPTPPKQVTPAEATPAPVAALEPLTKPEGTLLEKAKETILPIVEKAQVKLDAYADAAAEKVQQLADKIEGTNSAGDASRDLSGPAPTETTTTGQKAQDSVAAAKGVFSQVSSAVTSTFTQITNTIETRTTTNTHPGLITQVQNAVAKGQEKIESLLDGTTTVAHPVQTTTNTVPHPAVPTAPATAGVTAAAPAAPATEVPVTAIHPQ